MSQRKKGNRGQGKKQTYLKAKKKKKEACPKRLGRRFFRNNHCEKGEGKRSKGIEKKKENKKRDKTLFTGE